MSTHISRWGNSYGIRLPKSIIEQAGLSEGTPIKIEVEEGVIRIKKTYDLNKLLERVTDENMHTETLISSPVGKEMW